MSTTPGDIRASLKADIGRRDPKKAAMSGWIGSALEYYDFALYSLAAALVFPPIFFPSGNPTVALIASLATYAVGYFARPIGAVVLGAWGDRHGRKNVLVFAMFLMGFSTFAGRAACPPTHRSAILAPILLVVLRADPGLRGGRRARRCQRDDRGALPGRQARVLRELQPCRAPRPARSWPPPRCFRSPRFFPTTQFQTWGWRIPFLLSAFVILAGYLIRRRVQEPPAFTWRRPTPQAKRRLPLIDLLRTHPWGTCPLHPHDLHQRDRLGDPRLRHVLRDRKGLRHRLHHQRHALGDPDGQHRRGGDHPALRRAVRPDRPALADDLRRARRRPAVRPLPVHRRAEEPVPGHP